MSINYYIFSTYKIFTIFKLFKFKAKLSNYKSQKKIINKYLQRNSNNNYSLIQTLKINQQKSFKRNRKKNEKILHFLPVKHFIKIYILRGINNK